MNAAHGRVGLDVTIVKLCSQWPSGTFHASHGPARAYIRWSRSVNRNGTLYL